MSYKTNRDLSFLYDNLDDVKILEDDKIAEKRIKHFVDTWKDNESYLQDSSVLKDALDSFSILKADYFYGTKSSLYYWMNSVLNQDEKLKALNNKADEFSIKIMLELSFFELSL